MRASLLPAVSHENRPQALSRRDQARYNYGLEGGISGRGASSRGRTGRISRAQMVIVEHSVDGIAARIQARGNFSLGAGGLLGLLTALATLTLGLAAILAWQGYWPVLTIACVQLALVFWALVRAWRNAWIVEEICIDATRVRVRRRRYRKVRQFEMPAAWAGVRVESPRFPGHAPRVFVGSGDERLELGTYLTTEEKLSLAKHLTRAVSRVNAWR